MNLHERPLGMLLTVAALGLLLGIGCTKTADRVDDTLQDAEKKIDLDMNRAMKQLAEDKRVIAADLRELREDIDVRLGRLDQKLERENTKPAERAEWRQERAHLMEQRVRVEKALDRVTDADTDTWMDVKNAVNKDRDEVGTWLEQEAEKIDRKTDADADDDGH